MELMKKYKNNNILMLNKELLFLPNSWSNEFSRTATRNELREASEFDGPLVTKSGNSMLVVVLAQYNILFTIGKEIFKKFRTFDQ